MFVRRDSGLETWQTLEKPSLGEPGTSQSELKPYEHDEDVKVEDGTLLRIVHAHCDTKKTKPEARLQMLEISLVSHLVPLFPFGRDPKHFLARQGYSRRVETPRRHLVDDALSALNWLSVQRGPLSFAHNPMQDACVARVDNLACAMLGGVPNSAQALSKVSQGLDAYDSGAGSSTLASRSFPKLSLPVDATGSCCLLSVLPDSAKRYRREPERMVNDAIPCSKVMSQVPESYFDPVGAPPTHISRTGSFVGSDFGTQRKGRPFCGPQR